MKMSFLKGKKVGITRPYKQSKAFAQQIISHGGTPVLCPLFKVEPLFFSPNQKKMLLYELDEAEWVVFTSINTIKCLLLCFTGLDVLKQKKLAAVGKKTAEYLEKQGLQVDLIPDRYTAADLAERLIKETAKGTPIFLPSGKQAGPGLKNQLNDAELSVYHWTIYEIISDAAGHKALESALVEGKLDFITFFSPSAVRQFDQILHQALEFDTMHPVIACIGKVTASQAKSLNYQVEIVPEDYTSEALIAAIGDYIEEEYST